MFSVCEKQRERCVKWYYYLLIIILFLFLPFLWQGRVSLDCKKSCSATPPKMFTLLIHDFIKKKKNWCKNKWVKMLENTYSAWTILHWNFYFQVHTVLINRELNLVLHLFPLNPMNSNPVVLRFTFCYFWYQTLTTQMFGIAP